MLLAPFWPVFGYEKKKSGPTTTTAKVFYGHSLITLMLIHIAQPYSYFFRHHQSIMERLYALPYNVLECPHIKLKWPSWFHTPSAMTMYVIVLVSYFLVTGGK